jgi:hypothetical protein
MDSEEDHEEDKRRGGATAAIRGVDPCIGAAQPPVGTAVAPTSS